MGLGEPSDYNQPSRVGGLSLLVGRGTTWSHDVSGAESLWEHQQCNVEIVVLHFFPPSCSNVCACILLIFKTNLRSYIELRPCFTSCGKIGKASGNCSAFPGLRLFAAALTCGILPRIIHSASYPVQHETCAFPSELILKFPCRVSLIKFRE